MFTFAGCVLYLVLFLGSIFVYYAISLDATNSSRDRPPMPEAVQVVRHRHTCRYCRQICIPLSCDISNQNGILIRLNLTYQQVVEAEARDCPLLERVHDASTAAPSVRILSQLQTFFDIFSASSDLHTLTGCSTIVARALYFVRGLSSRPFHLRLGQLSSEPGGTLRARVLYTAWRFFKFEISANQGDEMSSAS